MNNKTSCPVSTRPDVSSLPFVACSPSSASRSTAPNLQFFKSLTAVSLTPFLLLLLVPTASAQKLAVRELETDRPDATESPVTVDKGFFQVESSFISYTYNDHEGILTDTYAVGESNIKYGVLTNTDLQLVLTPYLRETTETAGSKDTVEDFGDIQFRAKINLWGNDEGETALAVMPLVKIPTQTEVSNGRWEGGLIVPFAWRAGERWGLGFQGEFDRVFNEDDRTMDWDFAHTAVVGFDVTDRVGVYLEYLGVAGDHPYFSFLSTGGTFMVNDRVQLDAGTLIGLTEESEDVAVFSGITFKF